MKKLLVSIFIAGIFSLLYVLLIKPAGQRPVESVIEPTLPPLVSRENAHFYSDYEKLWHIIENEYPFLTVAERVTVKDFDSIKNHYLAKILNIDTHSQFYSEIVVPCINEFSYTGHLFVIPPEEYDRRYQDLQHSIDHGDITPCGIHNWEQFNLPAVREFYNKPHMNNLSVKVGNDALANFPEANNVSSNLIINIFPEYSAAYISIKHMTSFNENNDELVLKSFFVWIEENNYKHCILDLQNNSGGSDGYWMLNIVRPNLKKPLSYQFYALINGERSRQYIEANNKLVYPISGFPVNEFPNLNLHDFSKANYYSVVEVSSDNMGRSPSDPYEPLFSGDFWLLTGPKMYSSSDSFAAFCKQTKFARLVGTATAGDGMGLTPMVISLPATGICIQFSTMACLNEDGSNNEEFGTKPDILVSDGVEPLTSCLKEISAVNENLYP